MLKISKAEAAGALRMETLHHAQELTEKLQLFEQQYGSFEAFERIQAQGAEESFEAWDAYMEWKACRNELAETHQRIEELKRADIELA